MDIIYFDEITSTNDYARENILPHFSIIIANKQTAGRGRFDRKWESPEGTLALTIVLEGIYHSNISLIAGLATYRVVSKTIPNIGIKWSNDIVIAKKKLGGILVEMLNGKTIIGIGINVNNSIFSDEISNKATSIFNETDKIYDKTKLGLEIAEEFKKIYNKDFKLLKNEYKANCVNIGINAVDIADDGALIDNNFNRITFGESLEGYYEN